MLFWFPVRSIQQWICVGMEWTTSTILFTSVSSETAWLELQKSVGQRRNKGSTHIMLKNKHSVVD